VLLECFVDERSGVGEADSASACCLSKVVEVDLLGHHGVFENDANDANETAALTATHSDGHDLAARPPNLNSPQEHFGSTLPQQEDLEVVCVSAFDESAHFGAGAAFDDVDVGNAPSAQLKQQGIFRQRRQQHGAKALHVN
jgi:hypothetical protein